MGMTITEKIIARAAGKKEVRAGEIVTVAPDWIMTNDATTHISLDVYNNKVRNKRIAQPERTVFIIDHNVPSESEKTTHVQNIMRKFARDNSLVLIDGEGVCHQLMAEKFVLPGEMVLGADSHTCSMGALGALGIGVGSTDFVAAMVTGFTWLMIPETIKFNLKGGFNKGVYARDLILRIIGDIKSDGATYKAMEFDGPALREMTFDDRFVLCNLCVEAGAKNGIIPPDRVIDEFLRDRGRKIGNNEILKTDPDAVFERVYEYDLSKIEPAAVSPHFVDNYDTASNKEKENITVNEGFIGSCNNGRIEELRISAGILKNKRIKNGIKLLVSPASRNIYLQALNEGLIEIFLESGAIIINPNCSVCWGSCQGVLGTGEVLISTGTRNFKGRCGSKDSFVYLGSAATVTASCIEGKIVDPRNYL